MNIDIITEEILTPEMISNSTTDLMSGMSSDAPTEEAVEELTCNSRQSVSSSELLLLVLSNYLKLSNCYLLN